MDLIEYIESLPEKQIGQLYESASICRVVLQQLPSLAAQYIARLLLVPGGAPEALLAAWPLREAASSHDAAIKRLTRLGLLRGDYDKLGNRVFAIDRVFRHHILNAALARGCLASHAALFTAPYFADPEAVEAYGQSQWEDVLLLLVNGEQSRPVGGRRSDRFNVAELLASLGLLELGSGRQNAHITEKGFNFLLMEMHQQSWILVRQYIQYAAKKHGLQVKEILELLLQWGAAVNQQVEVSSLSSSTHMIAQDLSQLGLFMPCQIDGTSYLVATSLASLVSQGGDDSAVKQGFIIVETNFRVYAYTTSVIQKAILQFFVKGEVLLPNLFIGTITRQSVLDALNCGTTGEQIIAYLQQHAHPRISSRVPAIPGVVTDQIRLWDKELKRLQATRTVLYSNFESRELFEQFWEFSRSTAVYVNSEKQQIVVPSEFHEDCKSEIKRIKQMLGL